MTRRKWQRTTCRRSPTRISTRRSSRRSAGARGFLGGVVRPLQAARPDGRRAGDRLRRQGHDRQAERRREPQRSPDQFQIRGIPTLLLFKGGQVVESVVGLAREGRRSRRSSTSTSRKRWTHERRVRNVIIIGSGPAGLTAALYTARANLKPLVIEGLEAGGQLMLTTLVENWPGYRDGIMGPELMAEMRAQAERFGAEIIQGHVTTVDLATRPFTVKTDDAEYTARRADHRDRRVGAAARAAVASARSSGHGVSTCATCDGYFFRGQEIAVVGGGDSAMEEAIFLTKFASQGHRRAPPRRAARVEDHAGQGAREPEDRVRMLNTEVERRSRTSARAKSPAMVLRDIETGARQRDAGRRRVRRDRPHAEHGAVHAASSSSTRTATSSRTTARKTNVPGVFACGDVQDHIYRQADHRRRLGLHGGDRRRALPRQASRQHVGEISRRLDRSAFVVLRSSLRRVRVRSRSPFSVVRRSATTGRRRAKND